MFLGYEQTITHWAEKTNYAGRENVPPHQLRKRGHLEGQGTVHPLHQEQKKKEVNGDQEENWSIGRRKERKKPRRQRKFSLYQSRKRRHIGSEAFCANI
eukprot:1142179-Pelagomonas_calceolata.AAC.1